MTQVREATLEDVDVVSNTVAAAFASDVGWGYMFGPGNVEAMRSFARALLIPRIRRGTAWVTDDCAAVAMWDRCATDLHRDEDHEARWASCRAEVGEEAWQRIAVYDDAVGSAGPARPYWYLGVLATHPDAQGRGLATAVLQPGFEAAAADGWDCWLETSAPANKTFYAGRGFTEGREFEVPGGPTTWWLRRPSGPRPSPAG